MAKLARVVVPGVPHHVTQRGNRRLETFFEDGDYKVYLELMVESCAAARLAVWAYCLMPNHVPLVLVPRDADGVRTALGEAHRRFRKHGPTGRPLSSRRFVERPERRLGRTLAPQNPGPKPKDNL